MKKIVVSLSLFIAFTLLSSQTLWAVCGLSIENITPSSCDPATGEHSITIVICTTDEPAVPDVEVDIDGNGFAAPATGSPLANTANVTDCHVLTVTNLTSDGASHDVNVRFTNDMMCGTGAPTAYNAPAPCTCPESITAPTNETANICTGDDADATIATAEGNIAYAGTGNGAADFTIEWFTDPDYMTAYAPATAINHSGADNCQFECVTLYGRATCTAGDNSISFAGIINLNVYPDPQAPTIVRDNDVCDYTIQFACPNIDAIGGTNTLVTPSNPGDAATVADIEITNAGGCMQTFNGLAVAACPAACAASIMTPADETDNICTGDDADATIATAEGNIVYATGSAADFTIEWFEDPDYMTAYAPATAINHSGTDNCQFECYTLYGRATCNEDGSIQYAGIIQLNVYPDPQAPTIVRDNDVCDYTIQFACPNIDAIGGTNTLVTPSNPGDAATVADIEITNAGGCMQTFNGLAVAACPAACAASIMTPADETDNICTGDDADATIATAEGNIVYATGSAADFTIEWFEDPDYMTAYAPATAINHSGTDNCQFECYTLYGRATCNEDGSIQYAGIIQLNVYPDPQAPTIVRDNDVCDYTIQFACPNIDAIGGTNTLVTPRAPGDPATNADVEITNAGGCAITFTNLNVDLCPANTCGESINTVANETDNICTGGNADDAITAAEASIVYANTGNGAADFTITWWFEPDYQTQYNNGDAINHSGADACDIECVLLYGRAECVDASIQYAGIITLNVYPNPQMPTIIRDDAVCNYRVEFACPNLDDFGGTNTLVSPQAPGSTGNTADIEVVNDGGCAMTFNQIPVPDCPAACQESITATAEEMANICTGDNADASIAAAEGSITYAGTGGGAADFTIEWFLEPDYQTLYNNGDAINHSGTNPCEVECVLLYGRATCNATGAVFFAGLVTLNVYPMPQAPTIIRLNEQCDYTIQVACTNIDMVGATTFVPNQPPGSPASIADVEITNAGGCTMNFTAIPVPACQPLVCDIAIFGVEEGDCYADNNGNPVFDIQVALAFQNPPAGGTLEVDWDGDGVFTDATPAINTNITLVGVPIDGGTNTISIRFSADPNCSSNTIQYTEPADCTQCAPADAGTIVTPN